MIEIIKDMKNESQSLQRFRANPASDGTFKSYSKENSLSELREILLKEQGYICCYCMSSINISSANTIEKTKIEHYQARDGSRKVEVHYKNLYLACDGRKQCSDNDEKYLNTYKSCRCKYKDGKSFLQHCDTCKGNRKLDYIKLDKITQDKIKYTSSGIIYSDDENIDYELNHILNLNTDRLISNRKQAKSALWKQLPKQKTWSANLIKKILLKYKNSDKKSPYIGILLYFLNRKLP
jgi:hypothetical protein